MDLPAFDPDEIEVRRSKAKPDEGGMLDSLLRQVRLVNPMLLVENVQESRQRSANYEKWRKRKRDPNARVMDSAQMKELDEIIQRINATNRDGKIRIPI